LYQQYPILTSFFVGFFISFNVFGFEYFPSLFNDFKSSNCPPEVLRIGPFQLFFWLDMIFLFPRKPCQTPDSAALFNVNLDPDNLTKKPPGLTQLVFQPMLFMP